MAQRFLDVDRATPYLLPPSVDEWVEAKHLSRFVVDVVDQLDLSALEGRYSGRGKKAYHPSVLVAMLFYGYATGVYSSGALERASYDSVAFRYLCANLHPDHDTLAEFRKGFRSELSALFVQILGVAQQMGMLKVGKVALDGPKRVKRASANVAACGESPEGHAPITPSIALSRESHHLPLLQRFAPTPPEPLDDADAMTRMAWRLKTPAGKALYGLRKQVVEPVFGIIKQTLRLRQFLLRGQTKVSSEWDLVCMGYNLKRMHLMMA